MMKKISKKIIIFSPYYPPHLGGLETHAEEFNRFLASHVDKITVFTPRLPKSSPMCETSPENIEILRFPAIEIVPNYPLPAFWDKTFWTLLKKIRAEDYDIIISRTRFFLTSLLALLYAKLTKTKLIHIEHGSDFVQLSSIFKTRIAWIYDMIFGRLIFKYSDLNISISQAVHKFVFKFDKRTSPVIYRGIDMDHINTIKPNIVLKKASGDKTIITFVGRLYKWKGVENSIKAIQSLPKEIKDAVIFYIIGDGEDFDKLKNLTQNDATIKMLGSVSRKEALSILKISDIYIHSAHPGGGLSTSLLEAMYCKNAIIASPHEGANEIINKKNGLLMTDNSTKNINYCIKKLIRKSDLCTKFGKNAHKTITQNFTWGNSIQKYEKIITNIL